MLCQSTEAWPAGVVQKWNIAADLFCQLGVEPLVTLMPPSASNDIAMRQFDVDYITRKTRHSRETVPSLVWIWQSGFIRLTVPSRMVTWHFTINYRVVSCWRFIWTCPLALPRRWPAPRPTKRMGHSPRMLEKLGRAKPAIGTLRMTGSSISDSFA